MPNKFYYWVGRSGASYSHSVYTQVPHLGGLLNYVFVRRNPDGSAKPLYIGETDDMERRWSEHVDDGRVEQARKLGLNELHIYRLARTASQRKEVETDLRHGNPAPLNQQGVPKVRNALAGYQPSSELAHLSNILAENRLMSGDVFGQAPRSALAQALNGLAMTDSAPNPAPSNAFSPSMRNLLTNPQPVNSLLTAAVKVTGMARFTGGR